MKFRVEKQNKKSMPGEGQGRHIVGDPAASPPWEEAVLLQLVEEELLRWSWSWSVAPPSPAGPWQCWTCSPQRWAPPVGGHRPGVSSPPGRHLVLTINSL